MTYFESMERTQRMMNKIALSPVTTALAAMPYSAIQQQIDQINGISGVLAQTARNAFYQVDQISQLFKTSEFQRQLEQVQGMGNALFQATQIANSQVDSALSYMRDPAVQAQLAEIGRMGKLFQQISSPQMQQITSALEAYRSPALQMQLDNFQSISKATLSAIGQFAQKFDFSDIQFNDNGTLVYEGVEYSQEAIEEEFHLQVKEAESNPSSLKESVDKFKEKYWLIGLIVWLLMFLPQLPQTIDFYGGIISQVYQAINQENPVCYVIKERAYLREESNAKSKIVATLFKQERQ